MPIGYGQSKDCFRREKAVAWAHILVGYEYNPKGNPTVRYAAGQPMVVYSSWCAMALTHHLIVRVAALRAGFPHFTSYSSLRDDFVIADAAVAQQYRTLLPSPNMPIPEIRDGSVKGLK